MQELGTFIANHLALSYAFATTLVLLMVVESIRAKRQQLGIDVNQAVQLINRQKATIIDVRSSDRYAEGHIIDSQSLPSSTIESAGQTKMNKLKKRPVVVVCNNGTESQKVAALLIKQGYNAFSLAGGMRAWKEAELPVIKN